MPSKSISTNQAAPSAATTTTTTEHWWQAAGPGPFPSTGTSANAPNHPLLNHSVEMLGSKDDQSLSNAADDEDETSKDSETTGSTSTPHGIVWGFLSYVDVVTDVYYLLENTRLKTTYIENFVVNNHIHALHYITTIRNITPVSDNTNKEVIFH